jgi:hypothetical protein
MAHHLAALVVAAEDENVTLKQRTEIVDTILKVWAARKTYPGEVPAYQLDLVFSALDMLGDDRPWRFSRLRNVEGLATDDAEIPLAVMAVNLERLTRETLLALIWLACQDAIANEAHWLEAAEALGESIEDELATSTRRISRRLLDLTGDVEWNPESQDDEKTVKTAVITRRLRAMSVELITLADELERRADGDGLGR